jgi:Zn-finger nucleic acid-binding protein
MLNCPVCATAMTEIEKAGVTVDTCPKCRGVWLDRGELEKIGERLGRDDDSSSRPVASEPVRPAVFRNDDRYDRPRRDDGRRYDDDDDDSYRHGQRKSGMRRFMDFFD